MIDVYANGEVVKANFNRWVKAVERGNPKEVAELFLRGSSFHPTMIGDMLFGQEGAERYFIHFLAKNPTCQVAEEVVHSLPPQAYIHVGNYAFQVDNGRHRADVNARFTFVWERVNGTWGIRHFHSSVVPG